jgi:uncharacterized repeat protein (TIGR03837 family)
MLWDVFCRVIDNFGDIGVCWRLCRNLVARGQVVRLWVDDSTALQWMAPDAANYATSGLTVHDWQLSTNTSYLESLPRSDVWVESFGCTLAPEFIAYSAGSIRLEAENDSKKMSWINLEYLSAESYVAKTHRLPSPVMSGPGAGLVKHFFYPGFTSDTGGLLREAGLKESQSKFAADRRLEWLHDAGIVWKGELLISLFCYEPPLLTVLIAELACGGRPTQLLVTSGRAALATTSAMQKLGWISGSESTSSICKDALTVNFLTPMSQQDYDQLLWSCDLNFVRGEDSLVRAIWAGKPFVWHIYPQEDDAHLSKLDAFLDWLDAPESLRRFHHRWNGTGPLCGPDTQSHPQLLDQIAEWGDTVSVARSTLLLQQDLCTSLIEFAEKNR